MNDTVHFVFDLDDTLYPERDYVCSAFAHIGHSVSASFGVADPAPRLYALWTSGAVDPVGSLWLELGLPEEEKASVIEAMRRHHPSIVLRPDAAVFLDGVRARGHYAIVTDGRSVTQRAKIAALGCDDAYYISISEEVGLSKTDPARFVAVEDRLGKGRYVYVGDNPAKDFVAPNLLGWRTVMLENREEGIHSQTLPEKTEYHPEVRVGSFDELSRLLADTCKEH